MEEKKETLEIKENLGKKTDFRKLKKSATIAPLKVISLPNIECYY